MRVFTEPRREAATSSPAHEEVVPSVVQVVSKLVSALDGLSSRGKSAAARVFLHVLLRGEAHKEQNFWYNLLAGGTKKTQQEDIKLAKLIAAQI